MNKEIKSNIEALLGQRYLITDERKTILHKVADAIKFTIKEKGAANILYVCTHNSRRSHFGQVAGNLAAAYFGIENVACFSAGTEVTAMNVNAVNALVDFGFSVSVTGDTNNPMYTFGMVGVPPIQCFSKRFDDATIPNENVIAVMTCTDAEQNCPFIPAAIARIGLPYNDPKQSDSSGKEQEVYAERFQQILTEALYVFSLIK